MKKELGTELEYFSANVEIGPEGVAKINPIGKVTEFESGLIKAAIPELQKNIETVCCSLGSRACSLAGCLSNCAQGVTFIQAPKL